MPQGKVSVSQDWPHFKHQLLFQVVTCAPDPLPINWKFPQSSRQDWSIFENGSQNSEIFMFASLLWETLQRIQMKRYMEWDPQGSQAQEILSHGSGWHHPPTTWKCLLTWKLIKPSLLKRSCRSLISSRHFSFSPRSWRWGWKFQF